MTENYVVKSHVSTFSGANGGNCLEAALLNDASIRLTETRDPNRSILTDAGSMDAFIRGAKAGEFDWLLDAEPAVSGWRRAARAVLGRLRVRSSPS